MQPWNERWIVGMLERTLERWNEGMILFLVVCCLLFVVVVVVVVGNQCVLVLEFAWSSIIGGDFMVIDV
jgi:hypothetical protein